MLCLNTSYIKSDLTWEILNTIPTMKCKGVEVTSKGISEKIKLLYFPTWTLFFGIYYILIYSPRHFWSHFRRSLYPNGISIYTHIMGMVSTGDFMAVISHYLLHLTNVLLWINSDLSLRVQNVTEVLHCRLLFVFRLLSNRFQLTLLGDFNDVTAAA